MNQFGDQSHCVHLFLLSVIRRSYEVVIVIFLFLSIDLLNYCIKFLVEV
jgi:hypothetical protein